VNRRELAIIAATRAALADGTARARREAAGIRQREIAAVIGVGAPAVSQWESGKRTPGAANALAYGKALTAVGKPAA
jgi:transcriptional regulator with XRE-family HTH domain